MLSYLICVIIWFCNIVCKNISGMRTEINRKQGRPSERSEENAGHAGHSRQIDI